MPEKTKNKKLEFDLKTFEPGLVKDFIKYWSTRKSKPFTLDNVIKQIKPEIKPEQSAWLKLIESNHKFRTRYGEDIANELVRVIEEGDLSKTFGDFITP